MNFSNHVACIAHYHEENSKDKVFMRSLVITNLKNNKIILAAFFKLDEFTDDEACEEIDSTVRYFQDKGMRLDVVYSTESILVSKNLGSYNLKMILKEEYQRILKEKRKKDI